MLIIISLGAQNYDTISVKEDFDAYNDYLVQKHKICTISPNGDAFVFGDGMSKVLEGYLDIYDATGDKAYLYKFVMQSLCIVENRNDINPESLVSTPKWTESTTSTYADGYIIASLSRFVFFIEILYPELALDSLYQFTEIQQVNYSSGTCNCNFSGRDFYTFGEYAKWLSSRVDETFDYFFTNNLWSESEGMMQPSGGLVVNMQVGFARALLFMGLATGNVDYQEKAKTIAKLHKTTVSFDDKCLREEYEAPVFMLDEEKNSYWWYHMGWHVTYRNCKRRRKLMPNYGYFVAYIEDLNHGAIVSLFPYDYYKFAGDTVFTETDMIRFRNTFTKNIFDGEKYNMGVDGSNGTTYNDKVYDSVTIANTLKYSSLVYSRWSEFDDRDSTSGAPFVYDLTMNDYIKYFNNLKTLPSWYSGQKSLGHAMLIKEQWLRNDVDLKLANRDVVYDQDFYVSGNLIVEPQNVNLINKGLPYAEPHSFLDGGKTNRFVIESGVSVKISAGKSVHLKQGFYLKDGASLKIAIREQN